MRGVCGGGGGGGGGGVVTNSNKGVSHWANG